MLTICPHRCSVESRLCFVKTLKESYAMLVRVYEDQALSMKCVYKWFARFPKGRENVSAAEDKRPPSMIKTLRK
ncbi:hypothetical protein TNCV_4344471 [Trichonephila clavipes]|nr:hypothetical protein TNCV_4344471 [Trichonephila clavipes]